MLSTSPDLTPDMNKLLQAQHHDPFTVLGQHLDATGTVIRAFIPNAKKVRLVDINQPMIRLKGTDFFEWRGQQPVPEHYQLRWQIGQHWIQRHDPYTFATQLQDVDLHWFGEGRHWHIYQFLGAHPQTIDGIDGVLFAVWAPNAGRVSVVGDFNAWDGRVHPLRSRGNGGVWELFIPGLPVGSLYKFEILNRDSGEILVKTDPYGQQFEKRPATASVISAVSTYSWQDAAWLAARQRHSWLQAPLSIYEVHLGSWRRSAQDESLSYRQLAATLIPYVKDLGFTHIELLPLTEYPLDESWGYQVTGYYAATNRYGSADDLRYLIDCCHQQGIGVLLDWVPAHFPKDAHGLARFDGTALYEHGNPLQGEHRDWNTLIFNYGRNEVKNFLLASAIYWLQEFHLDGLRVDAVASMLYLDYSRQAGEWVPNEYGGNENLAAMNFLRQLNTVIHQEFPGALVIAEESTSWPQVTRPTWVGGLGFSMKWNMGWMHDTLDYMAQDPIYRHYHHERLTFGVLYCFSENFVLPFSHDEVVHGKKSLLNKMPGDEWQRFANLRLLLVYLFTYPGKKLLFMGCEFAALHEWNAQAGLDWDLLQRPFHQGVQALVRDLNQCYCHNPALHQYDFTEAGFAWIDCHDAPQSVLVYQRKGAGSAVVVVLNFTPVVREHYRIGVPVAGRYRECLNSDSAFYQGSNVGNAGFLVTDDISWMGQPCSLAIGLPPLAGIMLVLVDE